VDVAEVLATGVVVSTGGSDVAGAMGKSGVDEAAVVGTSAAPCPLVVLVQPATSAAAAARPNSTGVLITAHSMPGMAPLRTRPGATALIGVSG
jgi:hypothetical protein